MDLIFLFFAGFFVDVVDLLWVIMDNWIVYGLIIHNYP
jgi:hypothetical protein